MKIALWVLENSHLVGQVNSASFLFPECPCELVNDEQASSDFYPDNLPGTVAVFFLFKIETDSLEVSLHSQSGVLISQG